MRRLMICILVSTAALSCWATGQESDVIFIDGVSWYLLGRPISAASDLYCNLKDVLPEDRIWTSANWNGYKAYWSIRDERLCLDSIQVMIDNKETRTSRTQCVPDADMCNVFRDYYYGEDIVATWYTGSIRVGQGKRVRYEHAGFDRNYEHEQIFLVKEGKVVDSVAYHNCVIVDGFSFDDLFGSGVKYNEEKVAQLIPFPVENYTELDPDLVGSYKVTIVFEVYGIQVDSLGNLVDCKVKIDRIKGLESDEDLENRMAQDMKTTLMNIRPWRLQTINGRLLPNHKRYAFSYVITR